MFYNGTTERNDNGTIAIIWHDIENKSETTITLYNQIEPENKTHSKTRMKEMKIKTKPLQNDCGKTKRETKRHNKQKRFNNETVLKDGDRKRHTKQREIHVKKQTTRTKRKTTTKRRNNVSQ